MNLKYYLRGMGLGIVITAIVMGIAAGGKKETLSNEEVIARAEELGMVEGKVLADLRSKKAEEAAADVPAETAEPVSQPVVGQPAEDIESNRELGEAGEADADFTEEEGMGEGAPLDENIVFSVKKGEAPYRICERLEEAGLILSADEFDTFLLNNGYDRKIVASEYEIPSNADGETIARIITGQKTE